MKSIKNKNLAISAISFKKIHEGTKKPIFVYKNLAYGRQSISRPLRIEAQIPKTSC